MIKTQYSRYINKRTETAGLIPTIGPSNDHTDGTWGENDIYCGETFINMLDQKVYFGFCSGDTTGVSQIYPPLGEIQTNSSLSAGTGFSTTGNAPNITLNFLGVSNGTFNPLELDFDTYTLNAASTSSNIPITLTPLLTGDWCAYYRLRATAVDVVTYDTLTFESIVALNYVVGTGYIFVGFPKYLDNTGIIGSTSFPANFYISVTITGGVLNLSFVHTALTNNVKVWTRSEYFEIK